MHYQLSSLHVVYRDSFSLFPLFTIQMKKKSPKNMFSKLRQFTCSCYLKCRVAVAVKKVWTKSKKKCGQKGKNT